MAVTDPDDIAADVLRFLLRNGAQRLSGLVDKKIRQCQEGEQKDLSQDKDFAKWQDDNNIESIAKIGCDNPQLAQDCAASIKANGLSAYPIGKNVYIDTRNKTAIDDLVGAANASAAIIANPKIAEQVDRAAAETGTQDYVGVCRDCTHDNPKISQAEQDDLNALYHNEKNWLRENPARMAESGVTEENIEEHCQRFARDVMAMRKQGFIDNFSDYDERLHDVSEHEAFEVKSPIEGARELEAGAAVRDEPAVETSHQTPNHQVSAQSEISGDTTFSTTSHVEVTPEIEDPNPENGLDEGQPATVQSVENSKTTFANGAKGAKTAQRRGTKTASTSRPSHARAKGSCERQEKLASIRDRVSTVAAANNANRTPRVKLPQVR